MRSGRRTDQAEPDRPHHRRLAVVRESSADENARWRTSRLFTGRAADRAAFQLGPRKTPDVGGTPSSARPLVMTTERTSVSAVSLGSGERTTSPGGPGVRVRLEQGSHPHRSDDPMRSARRSRTRAQARLRWREVVRDAATHTKCCRGGRKNIGYVVRVRHVGVDESHGGKRTRALMWMDCTNVGWAVLDPHPKFTCPKKESPIAFTRAQPRVVGPKSCQTRSVRSSERRERLYCQRRRRPRPSAVAKGRSSDRHDMAPLASSSTPRR